MATRLHYNKLHLFNSKKKLIIHVYICIYNWQPWTHSPYQTTFTFRIHYFPLFTLSTQSFTSRNLCHEIFFSFFRWCRIFFLSSCNDNGFNQFDGISLTCFLLLLGSLSSFFTRFLYIIITRRMDDKLLSVAFFFTDSVRYYKIRIMKKTYSISCGTEDRYGVDNRNR